MSEKDYRVAHSEDRRPSRPDAGFLLPVMVFATGLVLLCLGYFFGAQVLGECRDPGGCTETPIFVVSVGGTLNAAGWLLLVASILIIVGIVLLLIRIRRKRVRETP